MVPDRGHPEIKIGAWVILLYIQQFPALILAEQDSIQFVPLKKQQRTYEFEKAEAGCRLDSTARGEDGRNGFQNDPHIIPEGPCLDVANVHLDPLLISRFGATFDLPQPG